jgi:hypothetical protein
MTQTSTNPIVEVPVPDVKMDKGEREYQAFLRLLPQLLVSHRGQFTRAKPSTSTPMTLPLFNAFMPDWATCRFVWD